MIDYSDNAADAPIQKCAECERDINQDYDYYDYNLSGDIICEDCESSHWDSAVMVYEYDPNEESMRRIDYAYTLGKTRDIDNYDTFEGTPVCIKGAKWEGTSGWRGYIAVEFNDGYESVANGWTTDRYDDVKWKWSFNDFIDRVHDGTLIPPVEVWFVFAQTSNVFSTSTDVVVRTHQADTFMNWLADEAGLTRDELQEALR
jgi:hypothetical protein